MYLALIYERMAASLSWKWDCHVDDDESICAAEPVVIQIYDNVAPKNRHPRRYKHITCIIRGSANPALLVLVEDHVQFGKLFVVVGVDGLHAQVAQVVQSLLVALV